MKTLMLATAAVALTAAISLSSASAAQNQIVTGAAQTARRQLRIMSGSITTSAAMPATKGTGY